ncbi:hypothetical protein BST61_g5771 [Cercospora zeina]
MPDATDDLATIAPIDDIPFVPQTREERLLCRLISADERAYSNKLFRSMSDEDIKIRCPTSSGLRPCVWIATLHDGSNVYLDIAKREQDLEAVWYARRSEGSDREEFDEDENLGKDENSENDVDNGSTADYDDGDAEVDHYKGNDYGDPDSDGQEIDVGYCYEGLIYETDQN